MAGFFSQLMARPEAPQTRLSRYTERCGVVYISLGLAAFCAPALLVTLGWSAPFEGQEEGLIRLMGFLLIVVGYFYIFGGRTHQTAFGLSTVVDRLLVPFGLGFIYLVSEIELMLVLPMAALDPLLGLGAYVCWRRDEADAR